MNDCPPDPTPAAASVQRQLASLRHLDLRRHSIEDLTERVRALLQGQPLRCLEFAPGLLLYRGIPSEELPLRLADVSYPPAERVLADQRANRAGQPLFYCSATWHPPFFEARVQPGDRIVISRWRTRQPLRILSFGYADICADDPHTDRDQALRRALAQLPDPARRVATFLTNAFTKSVGDDNRHHYRLSIAIAEACRLGSAFDGLLLPLGRHAVAGSQPGLAPQLPRPRPAHARLRGAPAREPRNARHRYHRRALARHCQPGRQLGAARGQRRPRLPPAG